MINETLGMSKILFAFLLTAVAFIAFYLTHLIENRVNGLKTKPARNKIITYSSAVGLAFFVLIIITIVPDSKSRLETHINKELKEHDFSASEVPADKLASEIVSNYYKINIIDVRNPEAFKAYHLPFAINMPLEKMDQRVWKRMLDQKHKVNYFYAADQQEARIAYLYAEKFRKAENFILTQSAFEFRTMFSDLVSPSAGASKIEMNTYLFRQKTATDMAALVEALKNSSQPLVAKTAKIKGGC